MKSGTLLIAELFPVFLGLLSICILLFANQSNKLSSRLLAGNIACTTIYMLTAALTQTGFFINYPHFFRAFYPLYLLVYPLAYLYIRCVYRDETRLRKKDAWHIGPALLTALQFIPFYRLSAVVKREYLQNLFANKTGLTLINEGFLPQDVLSFSVNIIGLIYMAFAVKEVRTARSKIFLSQSLKTQWKPIFSWTSIFIAIHISMPVFFFFAVLLGTPFESRYFIFVLINGIILSFSLVFLFARPEILYGLPQPRHIENMAIESTPERLIEVETQEDLKEGENSVLQQPAYLADYAQTVKTLLDESQLFLQPGLTITQLSKQTNIPVHHLSALFNKYWGKGFNDYINICRIDYLQKNIDNPSWKNFTLEGRGREAGFNSRVTLFKAIKKHTGQSPSNFFETHQLSEKNSL